MPEPGTTQPTVEEARNTGASCLGRFISFFSIPIAMIVGVGASKEHALVVTLVGVLTIVGGVAVRTFAQQWKSAYLDVIASVVAAFGIVLLIGVAVTVVSGFFDDDEPAATGRLDDPPAGTEWAEVTGVVSARGCKSSV